LTLRNKELIYLAFLAPVRCGPDKVSALLTMAALTITNPAAIVPETNTPACSLQKKLHFSKF